MASNAMYWKITINYNYQYSSNSQQDVLENRIRYDEEREMHEEGLKIKEFKYKMLYKLKKV